jgi:hypothetical protein
MEGRIDQCQIQIGQRSQGELNGLCGQEEILSRFGLFYSRIRALRLEPNKRITLHPIKINNGYQGLQEGNLSFTNKIDYGLENLLDVFARDPQGRTKHGTK